jgi:uncharacterized membrane protein YdjX (TVP38/TMEM64 family)
MKSRRARSSLLLFLLLGLVGATGYFSYTALSAIFLDPEAFYAFVEDLGLWGPAALAGLHLLQVVIAPIPGQLLGMAAGYLYGVLWGTVISITGLALGSWIAIWLGRRLGRPFVERMASPDFIQLLDRVAKRHGLWAFFLVFFLPFLPTDVGCFVSGLTPLPIVGLVILSILGRLPGVLLLNWLGATSQVLSPEALAALLLAAAVGAVVMVHYRVWLQQQMYRLLRRMGIF